MPIVQYFGYVGSCLVALLLGLNWFIPNPAPDAVRADIDYRATIRISSMEKLPARIVYDTRVSTPTATLGKIAAVQSAFVFTQITPGPLARFERKRQTNSAKLTYNYSTDRFQPTI